jgi:lipoyl(octanoyl) transferase
MFRPSLTPASGWSHVERRASLEVFLLGQIDFRHCLALQEQLVAASYSRAGGTISLLVCEHSPVVTVGQAGSRADIELRDLQYAGRSLDVISVPRGGGATLHLPGQLAVYPIVPLQWYDWSVGEYLTRFNLGLQDALTACSVQSQQWTQRPGLWGNSGQLVSMGVAVNHWITSFGAQIHLLPAPSLSNYLVTDRATGSRIGSLQQENNRCVQMSHLRSRVLRSVAERFGCEQYHLHTGHPLLERIERGSHAIARAS